MFVRRLVLFGMFFWMFMGQFRVYSEYRSISNIQWIQGSFTVYMSFFDVVKRARQQHKWVTCKNESRDMWICPHSYGKSWARVSHTTYGFAQNHVENLGSRSYLYRELFCASVLQCVALCCSVFPPVSVCFHVLQRPMLCGVMPPPTQHTATHCNTLQHTATCYAE